MDKHGRESPDSSSLSLQTAIDPPSFNSAINSNKSSPYSPTFKSPVNVKPSSLTKSTNNTDKVVKFPTTLTSQFQTFVRKKSIAATRKSPELLKKSKSILLSMSVELVMVYRRCNPEFTYSSKSNPRRVLTKPSQGVKNSGWDNQDSDYILYVNDILGDKEGQKYLILDILGQGTFGQVVKCRNIKTKQIVAVKVIKNKPAYFNQSMMEVSILELLNSRYDPENRRHIVRMFDTFLFRKHLCLVFEILNFRGLSMKLVRIFIMQILDALIVLSEARIIHCDLKPENVLLKNLESPSIKVIDFGSACHEQQTVYTYIQSRFYRSPEVLLGLPYSSSIDMWSLGCIAVELYLGLPAFPGSSEFNQITRIVEMLGMPPTYMLEFGKNTRKYFHRVPNPKSAKSPGGYILKTVDQYNLENQGANERPSKRYFNARTFRELIFTHHPPTTKREDGEEEMRQREAFYDFVRGILNINPLERWSPQQAKMHPFITNQPYYGPFNPPMEFKGRPRHHFHMASESVPSSPAMSINHAPDSPQLRNRPRANTISSLKFGAVPPQLQKMAQPLQQQNEIQPEFRIPEQMRLAMDFANMNIQQQQHLQQRKTRSQSMSDKNQSPTWMMMRNSQIQSEISSFYPGITDKSPRRLYRSTSRDLNSISGARSLENIPSGRFTGETMRSSHSLHSIHEGQQIHDFSPIGRPQHHRQHRLSVSSHHQPQNSPSYFQQSPRRLSAPSTPQQHHNLYSPNMHGIMQDPAILHISGGSHHLRMTPTLDQTPQTAPPIQGPYFFQNYPPPLTPMYPHGYTDPMKYHHHHQSQQQFVPSPEFQYMELPPSVTPSFSLRQEPTLSNNNNNSANNDSDCNNDEQQ